MLNRRGSLALESLLSIFIYSLVTVLLLSVVSLLVKRKETDWYYFDIGCMQMQALIAECEIVDVNSDELSLICNGKAQFISWDNERIVKRDGYQILLNGITELEFELVEETVYMRGLYCGEEFDIPIAKKEWWKW